MGRFRNLLIKKWSLWSILILSGVFGLLLIVMPHFFERNDLVDIFRDIGIAFLTSTLLGFTVDLYLQRGIARDAFEGAMGYVLPEEVKGAVRWISNLQWLAEEFSFSVKIIQVESDMVECKLQIRKYLRNISNERLQIGSHIHIDDWGMKKRSKILRCSIRVGEQVEINNWIERVINSTVRADTELVWVRSGETVLLLAEAVEYKRVNSDTHYALGYAAKSPVINISVPDHFDYTAGWSSQLTAKRHPHVEQHVLDGLTIPYQRLVVRWWPKVPPIA